MNWLEHMLIALFKEVPEAIELVEALVKREKAKRVDEIRPPTSHSQQTLDELTKG